MGNLELSFIPERAGSGADNRGPPGQVNQAFALPFSKASDGVFGAAFRL
jgi:hypothetical protein